MAKRKRLTPADIQTSDATPVLETKSMSGPALGAPPVSARPPIAQVAGDAAAQAALEEVTDELRSAKAEGRMVQSIALDAINADHLVRDRLASSEEDMAALKDSLTARGQQTPIEVVDLGQGRYGLISGWRRLAALRDLSDETDDPKSGQIQCLIRTIDTDPDAYIAMVEENEIRANLSFYERARLAAEAARLGLYWDAGAAVSALFARATPAKRSKIISFVTVHEELGEALRFPAAIPERLGLALSAALQQDSRFAVRLKDALRKTPAETATEERTQLERALRKSSSSAKPERSEIAPDVFLESKRGRVVLIGKGVDGNLCDDLKVWLAERSL